jgi:hypothetical protein
MTEPDDLEARLIAAIRHAGAVMDEGNAQMLSAEPDSPEQARLIAYWNPRIDAASEEMYALLAEWREQRRGQLAPIDPGEVIRRVQELRRDRAAGHEDR